MCLELYKLLQAKPMDQFRNTFANLALPLFAMAEPIAAKQFKYGDSLKWTLWDRWVIEGDLTVRDLKFFPRRFVSERGLGSLLGGRSLSLACI